MMKSLCRQHLVEVGDTDAEAWRRAPADAERVEADDVHLQAAGDAGDLGADAPQADDAQRLAAQLDADELRALPLARLERGVRRRRCARARASIRPTVCSAAATVLPPGALTTTTPWRVAASTSMLSTPTPARPTTQVAVRLRGPPAVTLVSLRTTRAS